MNQWHRIFSRLGHAASRTVLRAVAVLVVLGLSAPMQAWSAEQASPRDLVMQASGQLVTALKVNGAQIRRNPVLAYRLAEDRVLPLIDFQLIARRVLGRHWQAASPTQREAFTRAFRAFLVNIFVQAMVTYSDEIVSHAEDVRYPPIAAQPGSRNAVVRMTIRPSLGPRAEVRYHLEKTDAGWKIHDVSVMGISFALTYRRSFSETIDSAGLDGLIERLAAHNQHHRLLPAAGG